MFPRRVTRTIPGLVRSNLRNGTKACLSDPALRPRVGSNQPDTVPARGFRSSKALAVTYDFVRQAAGDLYGWSITRVPDDTLAALARASESETSGASRRTLEFMQAAARAAEAEDRHACSDAGFPTYFVK